MKIIKIIGVKPVRDFVVELEFSDGLLKEVDLSGHLLGEVFEPIRNDPEYFRSVRVVDGERTISWPNGVDIDPYTLYYGLEPEWNDEDEAVATALEQRRKKIPDLPPSVIAPEIRVN